MEVEPKAAKASRRRSSSSSTQQMSSRAQSAQPPSTRAPRHRPPQTTPRKRQLASDIPARLTSKAAQTAATLQTPTFTFQMGRDNTTAHIYASPQMRSALSAPLLGALIQTALGAATAHQPPGQPQPLLQGEQLNSDDDLSDDVIIRRPVAPVPALSPAKPVDDTAVPYDMSLFAVGSASAVDVTKHTGGGHRVIGSALRISLDAPNLQHMRVSSSRLVQPQKKAPQAKKSRPAAAAAPRKPKAPVADDNDLNDVLCLNAEEADMIVARLMSSALPGEITVFSGSSSDAEADGGFAAVALSSPFGLVCLPYPAVLLNRCEPPPSVGGWQATAARLTFGMWH